MGTLDADVWEPGRAVRPPAGERQQKVAVLGLFHSTLQALSEQPRPTVVFPAMLHLLFLPSRAQTLLAPLCPLCLGELLSSGCPSSASLGCLTVFFLFASKALTGRTELQRSILSPHQHPLQVQTMNKSHLPLDMCNFAPTRCSGKTCWRTGQTDGTAGSFINYFRCRKRLLWHCLGSKALHNYMLIKV